MSVHWGGRGPGHVSRWSKAADNSLITLDFLSASLDSRITASGGTNGSRVNSTPVVIAGTTPRYDYDPVSAALKGLLIEGANTQIGLYSEQANNWSQQTNTTVTQNVINGPLGTQTADLVTRNSTATAYRGLPFTKAASDIAYTQMFVVKKSVGDYFALQFFSSSGNYARAVYNLTTGVISSAANAAGAMSVTSAQIFPFMDGYYLCVLTATISSAVTTFYTQYCFNSNGGYATATDSAANSAGYVGYGNVFAGSLYESYVATPAGSTVSRVADSLTMTGTNFSGWWATTTLVVIDADTQTFGTRTIWQADDGTTNNRITAWVDNGTVKLTIVTGGVSQAAITTGTITAFQPFRIAFRLTTDNVGIALDGGAEVTDTSVTLPTVDRCRFGASLAAGEELFGHVRRFAAYAG